MFGTAEFDFWWLIPLILIGLCFFWARGCCFGRRHHIEGSSETYDGISSSSALEILSRRYARGEIEEEEYERKRKTITQAKKGETR
jgi:uncharacterized membrane protein